MGLLKQSLLFLLQKYQIIITKNFILLIYFFVNPKCIKHAMTAFSDKEKAENEWWLLQFWSTSFKHACTHIVFLVCIMILNIRLKKLHVKFYSIKMSYLYNTTLVSHESDAWGTCQLQQFSSNFHRRKYPWLLCKTKKYTDTIYILFVMTQLEPSRTKFVEFVCFGVVLKSFCLFICLFIYQDVHGFDSSG